MKLDTIGKNIRKFREIKKLRQEDLAEKTDLTTNYIGMIERGEKIPSLETFINIRIRCLMRNLKNLYRRTGTEFMK